MDPLEDEERARLFERFGRTFEAGSTIFAEGEQADLCYLIQKGRVRLVKTVRSAERSITVLRAGDLFGEGALLPHATRSATAIALTPVSVLALDRPTFGSLLAGSAEVATRLVEQLVHRLHDAEEQLENAMIHDHPSRVVNTLVRLASTREPGEQGRWVKISPLELASRVGLDVDAVKRQVQQLRDGGYIHIADEHIIVPDLESLRQLFQLLGMKEDVRGGFS